MEIEGAVAIIATYDCAVVDEDFVREPWVQLLVAFPAAPIDALLSCRNPRRLHFPIQLEQSEKYYEVNAIGICQIERQLLCNIEPDTSFNLSADSKKDLNYWIAERFRQVTWPDAFNAAIKPVEQRLKSFNRRYNQYASALYIQLNTYEEIQSGKYEVSAILAIEDSCLQKLVNEMRVKNKQLVGRNPDAIYDYIANDIIIAFGSTVNFMTDVTTASKKAIEVMAENYITLSQLRKFYRFSPYSLSSQDSSAPEPVDTIPGKVLK